MAHNNELLSLEVRKTNLKGYQIVMVFRRACQQFHSPVGCPVFMMNYCFIWNKNGSGKV